LEYMHSPLMDSGCMSDEGESTEKSSTPDEHMYRCVVRQEYYCMPTRQVCC